MQKITFFEVNEQWEKDIIYNDIKGFEIQIFDKTINEVDFEQFKDSVIISVFIYSKVDSKIIENMPNLKLITTRSSGFDHIDLDVAQEKEISIANVPFYGQSTVAEYNFAHLLNISRKFCQGISRVRTGSFDFTGLRGFDLAKKTIGLLGFGHIGQKFARMAKGFDMEVLAYDINMNSQYLIDISKEIGLKFVDMQTIFEKCDIISLHLPLLESTRHILNEENFQKMREGVIILNTARGDLIDSRALLNALNIKKVSAVGLDVLEGEYILKEEIVSVLDKKREKESNFETLTIDHILMGHPRVFITPHNAFNTIDALKRILKTSIFNICEYAENGKIEKNKVKKE